MAKSEDWVSREKIKNIQYDPAVDDLEEFIKSITYWVVDNKSVANDMKVRVIISRLKGEP